MYKILVTGGCGFIGSNFINMILKSHNGGKDVKICNIDKLTYASSEEYIKGANGANYEFIKGDITKKEDVDLAMSFGPNCIVNFAAESHVDRSIDDSTPFINTNINGTHLLLEGALKLKKLHKFVQISTDEVYGYLPLNRPDLKFSENSPTIPSSPYAASKAAADHLALSYFFTHRLPVCITRCTNNYGKHQHNEKLIPTIINKCLLKETIPIYGTGLNVRDWIYVDDHCEAIFKVISKGRPGQVYNIGANCELTNNEMVQMIFDILNISPGITYVKDRKGHDLRYAVNPYKIHNEMNWMAKTEIRKGMGETVKYYRDLKKDLAKVWNIL